MKIEITVTEEKTLEEAIAAATAIANMLGIEVRFLWEWQVIKCKPDADPA